jgi:F-type H+-transporting ATPase subunit b
LTVFFAVFKYGGPAFNGWAEGQREKMLSVLNKARENHTDSVKQRIDSVKELTEVVGITKALFEVSKVSRVLLRWCIDKIVVLILDLGNCQA